jgi:hypothetical protein
MTGAKHLDWKNKTFIKNAPAKPGRRLFRM